MSAPTLERPRAEDDLQLPGTKRRRSGSFPALVFALSATFIATMGATASIQGVISDWGWLVQVGIVVLVVLLATNAARYLSAPRYLVAPCGGLAAVFSLTLLFFSNTAVLGFIPTGSTYRALLHVWSMANAQMGSQVPPVQTTGVIVFSVTLWAAAVALAVDTLAFTLRAPVFAGIPLAMLLVIASLFKPAGAGMVAVSVTMAGFLLVLAAARRLESASLGGRGRRLAVELAEDSAVPHAHSATKPTSALLQGTVLIAGAVATLMVLPLAVPGFKSGMLMEGNRPSWGNPATNIDPMISLGNDLRSNSPGTVLRYYTDDKSPMYLRTSVIGNLEGSKWKPDDGLLRVPVSEVLPVSTNPTLLGVGPEITTRVVTDKYRGVWLPMPGGSTFINGLPGNWMWNADTGTILAGEKTPMDAQDFIALSQLPEIDAKFLDSGPTELPDGFFDSVDSEYTQIPRDFPKSIPAATDKVLAGMQNASPFEKAVALQDYLRSGTFTYSEKTPVEDGYDGSGVQVIDAFLEKKAGYCVHFASTMALMARTLGIPSRIVTGYSPGTATGNSVPGSNGAVLNEYTVTARNAHAWPELYFQGAGWVAFEPTPGRGVPPAYAPALAASNPTQGQDPRQTNPTSKESAASSTAATSSAPVQAGNQEIQQAAPSPWPLVALLAALLLACVPALIRRRQRADRIRRIGVLPAEAKESGASAAWAELVALGIDYSKPMRQNESAGDYARRLSNLYPGASEQLLLLATAFERQRYAATPPSAHGVQGLGDALEAAEKSMGEALTPLARAGVRMWPRSVFAPRPLDPARYLSSR